MELDMGEEDDFEMYPNDEEFYEDYEDALEREGLPELEVLRRIHAASSVSPFDTHRQTVPHFTLMRKGLPRIRTGVTW
jgi:hypothetical protein